jgi:hypothetical protein
VTILTIEFKVSKDYLDFCSENFAVNSPLHWTCHCWTPRCCCTCQGVEGVCGAWTSEPSGCNVGKRGNWLTLNRVPVNSFQTTCSGSRSWMSLFTGVRKPVATSWQFYVAISFKAPGRGWDPVCANSCHKATCSQILHLATVVPG